MDRSFFLFPKFNHTPYGQSSISKGMILYNCTIELPIGKGLL